MHSIGLSVLIDLNNVKLFKYTVHSDLIYSGHITDAYVAPRRAYNLKPNSMFLQPII